MTPERERKRQVAWARELDADRRERLAVSDTARTSSPPVDARWLEGVLEECETPWTHRDVVRELVRRTLMKGISALDVAYYRRVIRLGIRGTAEYFRVTETTVRTHMNRAEWTFGKIPLELRRGPQWRAPR